MSRRWALFERVDAPDVNDPNKTVMVRWRIMQTPWFGIYLHRLDAPDQRSTLHDRPWPFLSFVLRGGYTEEFGRTTQPGGYIATSPREGRVVDRSTRSWGARSIRRMRARDPHTITALHRSPTWTLMLVGPRAPEPSWGYWDEDGWTAWDQHPHAAEFATALVAREGGER